MTTFITIIYVIVALVMVLSILLQAGKGGGLGSALGGGASQSVFGGGGGGDFMGKMTQGFAATFMICAMYLAYASAHAGSDFLEGEDDGSEGMLEADDEIDYERLGPRAQKLPTPEEGAAMQASATVLVPAQSEAPPEMIEASADEQPANAQVDAANPSADQAPEPAAEPAPDEPVEGDEANVRGDSPAEDRGDSPQSGKESLQNSAPGDKSLKGDDKDSSDKAPDDEEQG